MNHEKQEKIDEYNKSEEATKDGLAIAGFVTSISGLLISLTGIGAILGIPAMIVGCILGIIALKNKQKYKGLSIAAISISTISIVGGAIIINQIIDIADPLIKSGTEIQRQIEQDPELNTLMKNPEFKKAFENNLEARMQIRESELRKNIEEGNNRELKTISSYLAQIMTEETQAAIQETKEQFKK